METLLISDALFRSRDLAERKKFVALVDSVKENMGTVRIFSSLHVSGERKLRDYAQLIYTSYLHDFSKQVYCIEL